MLQSEPVTTRRTSAKRRARAALPVLLVAMAVTPAVSAPAASAVSHVTYSPALPDLQIEVPTDAISIGTADNLDPQLQFTHITWNAGRGPFVITPHYNRRTGTAAFVQTLYKTPGGTRMVKASKVLLSATGIFDPPSDYRYPLTSFQLIQVNPDQSLGPVVATSPKTDYCITSDTTVGGVPFMPNHPSPPQSDCVHPNKALGLAVGYGDEYDQTDNGQPIDLAGIPTDGQEYLLRAQVDPQHIFVESNATNDETDTYLTLNSDGSVTILRQTGPPQSVPSITLASPRTGTTVGGNVHLAVSVKAPSGTAVASVQYLLDGEPLGSPVTSAPFQASMPSGMVSPGVHSVSARVTDVRGDMATASAQDVTFATGGATGDQVAPSVVLANPAPGQTESGTVPIAAVVHDQSAGTAVQFELDAHPLGQPVTTAPFAMTWHTTSTTGGRHTLSVEVTDAVGHHAASASVPITVVNPAPAMTCFVDNVDVQANGHGSVRTTAFRTVSGGETVLALVSANSRSDEVTVTGGGLDWRMLRRVAGHAGVVEAWTATAPHQLLRAHVRAAGTRSSAALSLRVLSLEGVSHVGASSGSSGSAGAPHVKLVTTSDDPTLVFAAGVDLMGRPSLPHGWVSGEPASASGAGLAAWTQYTNQPVQKQGDTVRVSDATAVAGAWAMVAVEVVGDGS